MKKLIAYFLAILMLAGCFSVSVLAVGAAVSFDLSCGGKNNILAEQNDLIEVTFAIRRTDADESYYINALQNYIIYDEDFFEFVDGSAKCSRDTGFAGLVKAIARNKVYMTDMMDTLPSDFVFGTFQMKVIGSTGSGTIRNAEVKAYLKGSVAMDITCTDLTVTIGTPLSEKYTVTYDAGEGTVTPASETVEETESVTLPPATRPYFDLTGWSDGTAVYKAGTAYTPAASITLTAVWAEKALRAAPAVGSRDESGAGYMNGALLGTTADMEYSTDGAVWLPCGSGETNGLSAGTYQVRYAATDTEKAGIAASVTVELAHDTIRYNIPVTGDTTHIYASVTIEDSDAVPHITIPELERVIGQRIVTGDVVIDLTVLGDDVEGVIVPQDVLEAVSAAASSPDNDTNGLTIKLKVGSVTFDADALKAIVDQSGSDIRIVINAADLSMLNDAQRAALTGRELLGVFDVYLTEDGKRISDLGGGHATITISHTLAVGREYENLMVLYVAPDGALTRLAYTAEGLNVTFTLTHFSIYVITADTSSETACLRDDTCPVTPYADTDKNLWWHDGIHFCVENGLMIGIDDHTFAPDKTLNRAMAVTVLWRLAGRPDANAETKPFDDVDTGCWYTEPICWAAVTGAVEGYGNGLFGPEDDLTREQLATLLYRFASASGVVTDSGATLPFTDTEKINTWAVDAVRWCYGKGIILGRTDGSFDPQGTATRAEAAALFQRFSRFGA